MMAVRAVAITAVGNAMCQMVANCLPLHATLSRRACGSSGEGNRGSPRLPGAQGQHPCKRWKAFTYSQGKACRAVARTQAHEHGARATAHHERLHAACDEGSRCWDGQPPW